MKEKIIIFIIVVIIFIDIYYLISNKEKTLKGIEKVIKTETTPIKNKTTQNKTNLLQYHDAPFVNYIDNDKEVVHKKKIDVNMFGNPSDMVENKYILWDFTTHNPWTRIVYNYNQEIPFNFFIKIKIPSLNDYEIWKNIVPKIDFDPRTGELIIPAKDEESALSIANLIITHFKGEISIEDILKRNLIDISINKAKKYDIVKNKIREQIMSDLSNKVKESFIDITDYKTDLAKSNDNELSYDAYEGNEYAFI